MYHISVDYDMQAVLCWIKDKCEAEVSNTQTLIESSLCCVNALFVLYVVSCADL